MRLGEGLKTFGETKRMSIVRKMNVGLKSVLYEKVVMTTMAF